MAMAMAHERRAEYTVTARDDRRQKAGKRDVIYSQTTGQTLQRALKVLIGDGDAIAKTVLDLAVTKKIPNMTTRRDVETWLLRAGYTDRLFGLLDTALKAQLYRHGYKTLTEALMKIDAIDPPHVHD